MARNLLLRRALHFPAFSSSHVVTKPAGMTSRRHVLLQAEAETLPTHKPRVVKRCLRNSKQLQTTLHAHYPSPRNVKTYV